jgi:uncharacterized protein (TIGR04255 family)
MPLRTGEYPNFDNPPLIETILGVQFGEIAGLTSAHFGWYWREFLDKSWNKTQEAIRLPDQFETFGDQTWKMPVTQLTASIAPAPDRLQFINAEDDRVIQIQNTRFLYNWRKKESVYPRFHELYPEFTSKLADFRKFLGAASLEDLSLNQWEVTYVNHIPKGALWNTPEDWHKILPGLMPMLWKSVETKVETESGELRFEIVPQRGRLHVSVQHGRRQDPDGEVLVLQLTARGPLSPTEQALTPDESFELGHRVLVQTFAGIASPEALTYWGKREP